MGSNSHSVLPQAEDNREGEKLIEFKQKKHFERAAQSWESGNKYSGLFLLSF